MQALCEQLGEPQRSYRTLHVVGTNGKSSVTRYCAALLEAAGLRTGACLSPHRERWSERTEISGLEIEPGAFAAAAEQVAAAAAAVEAALGEGERVTQFEAAIAISFVAFREAAVDAAVVEAGLGGRLDATNMLDSAATALTSVGLDHTEWLGETRAEIATEKLAVLVPASKLVAGALDPEIEAQARAAAEAAGCEYVAAPQPDRGGLPAGSAPYLRRNAGVAIELAATLAPRLEGAESATALASVGLPGRFEVVAGEPPLVLDVAHNPQGAAALGEALAAYAGARPVIACCALLADKDAEGYAAALAPALVRVICTEATPGPAMGRPGVAPLEAASLAAAFAKAGVEAVAIAEPRGAIAATLEAAAAARGVALCVGSHYLLRHVWTGKRDPSSSR